MLICKNCKHKNPTGQLKCGNCKVMLSGSMVEQLAQSSPMGNLVSKVKKCPNCGVHNSATMEQCINCNYPLTSSAQVSNEQKSLPIEVSGVSKICFSCKYPNIQIATICKQCGDSLDKTEAIAPKPNKKSSSPVELVLEKTMNPYLDKEVTYKNNGFSLVPITKSGEQLEVLNFEGEKTMLNRANLEADNMAITGKLQAIIEKKNGQWMIENQSDHQTTFIRVDKPLILKKGDFILLGNRLFKFDIEDDA